VRNFSFIYKQFSTPTSKRGEILLRHRAIILAGLVDMLILFNYLLKLVASYKPKALLSGHYP
jgi:hypothetical protein